MIKNMLFIMGSIVLFAATSGPPVLLFSNPDITFLGLPALLTWNIFIQVVVVGWVVWGIKKIPFIRGDHRE